MVSDCQALEVFKREKRYFTTGPGLSNVKCYVHVCDNLLLLLMCVCVFSPSFVSLWIKPRGCPMAAECINTRRAIS